MVYEGHITAADMVAMISERIHLLPRYRQKVVPAPLELAHPTWEDDPHFAVANHVAELTMPPAPGEPDADDRMLSRVCGELFCQLLDRDRPLWHLTVLHGYRGGGTVVFLKLHHAMVDGVSSVELIEVLHATEPGARPPLPPTEQWQPRPVPGLLDRLRDVVADQIGTGLDAAREVVDLVRPGALDELARRVATLARATVDTGPLALRPLEPTPFNARIHPARDFAWVELPIEETRQVRKALGGTVNDLVLAVLSGGLGRYMRRHGYPTEGRELQALCPVSVRRTDQSGALGNQISMVVAPLHVGITDGRARLEAEHASMQELKQRRQANGIHEVIAGADWWPAPLYRLVWKLWPRGWFPLHITSTNVPGPRQPLYLGEHELLHWYPFGVQWTNNALFLCTLSYREHLVLGPVADPEIVRDVWEFAADLRAAYDELRDAAGVVPAVAPVEDVRALPAGPSAAAPRRAGARTRAVRAGVPTS
jgi:WS/DGAT/MGAT family acyltransferase